MMQTHKLPGPVVCLCTLVLLCMGTASEPYTPPYSDRDPERYDHRASHHPRDYRRDASEVKRVECRRCCDPEEEGPTYPHPAPQYQVLPHINITILKAITLEGRAVCSCLIDQSGGEESLLNSYSQLATANYVTGPPTTVSRLGEKGDSGLRGPYGKAGKAGKTGPRGVHGMKGSKGNMGPTGDPCKSYYAAFSVGRKKALHSNEYYQTLVFDTEFVNLYNHFNMFTGKFFCYVPGIYFFSLNVHTWNQKETYMHVMKNEEEMVILYAQPSDRSVMQSQSFMLDLQQNDEVWVRLFKGERENAVFSDDYDTYITFSGYLVKATSEG